MGLGWFEAQQRIMGKVAHGLALGYGGTRMHARLGACPHHAVGSREP